MKASNLISREEFEDLKTKRDDMKNVKAMAARLRRAGLPEEQVKALEKEASDAEASANKFINEFQRDFS